MATPASSLALLALALSLTLALALALAYTFTRSFAFTLSLACTLAFALTLALAFTLTFALLSLALAFTLLLLIPALTQTARHRLHASYEIPSAVESLCSAFLFRITDGPRGVFEPLLEFIESPLSLALELSGVVLVTGPDQASRVAHALLELVVTNGFRSLPELVRSLALARASVGTQSIDLAL